MRILSLLARGSSTLLETIIDVASFVVARTGAAPGPTYRDVMRAASEILGLEGEERRLAEAIPGVRNVLVHGYAELRYDILYDIIVNHIDTIERLLEKLWERATQLDP